MLPNREGRRGFTLIELLVVMAIIGVLIALLLPAVQAARGAARRVECLNNMMQLGLGVQSYEVAFETLPPGSVDAASPIADKPEGYHFGWLAQVLPFVDQRNVYAHLNFNQSVYAEANSTTRLAIVSTYLCPSDGGSDRFNKLGWSNYAGNYHDVEAPIAENNNGLLFLNSHVRTEDIPDGASQTILFGERLGPVTGLSLGPELGWASGTGCTLRNGGTPINGTPQATPKIPSPIGGFGSKHPGGANFCFADGSVKFLKTSTNATVLQRHFHRADGELILEDL